MARAAWKVLREAQAAAGLSLAAVAAALPLVISIRGFAKRYVRGQPG